MSTSPRLRFVHPATLSEVGDRLLHPLKKPRRVVQAATASVENGENPGVSFCWL